MKKHIRDFYERLYLVGSGCAPGLGGKPLARELGYPDALIDLLPPEVWEDFLPCGNVISRIEPKEGERVLNLGCGAGVDSIFLKMSSRASFTVVNIDTAFPALLKARAGALRSGLQGGFELICAEGGGLPFAAASFDWIILNGVFNLFADKGELIGEMGRVLKPAGRVAGADLCRKVTLPDYFSEVPDAWAWCMSGAVREAELIEAFEARGFSKLELRAEAMDEFFDRAVFTFRKNGAGKHPADV